MNKRLSDELAAILREEAQSRYAGADREVTEALERLTNCESVLTLTIQALDARVATDADWRISESLHGALKLLKGCYPVLSQAVGQP